MKRLVIIGVSLLLGAAPISAQTATASAKRNAYSIALMCYGVAAYYHDDAASFRTSDALKKMARVLGYDNARMAKDMIDMANVLGTQLRSDPDSMERSRTGCRRIGFAS